MPRRKEMRPGSVGQDSPSKHMNGVCLQPGWFLFSAELLAAIKVIETTQMKWKQGDLELT